ncbi:hypothetical protein [Noviherbaspirillum soli]|uniref:hypothetical protein n=1 Tax=Noviherbaspirillum soli TaxID=1064518 RepID=UPI00188C3B11|nr:hypothetical protein [Noviherbaspirillum soli]
MKKFYIRFFGAGLRRRNGGGSGAFSLSVLLIAAVPEAEKVSPGEIRSNEHFANSL